uniref:Uncharacterized protein n=1 Tax=Setaria italica TaxID=4555 RepID=K3Z1C4_SETIT
MEDLRCAGPGHLSTLLSEIRHLLAKRFTVPGPSACRGYPSWENRMVPY